VSFFKKLADSTSHPVTYFARPSSSRDPNATPAACSLSIGGRGRRQTDGHEKRRYQRHGAGHGLNLSGLAQPVRNRPVDQLDERARCHIWRLSCRDPASRGCQSDDRLEQRSQLRISALLAHQGGQHLADTLATQPQDRQNAAAFQISFERLQSVADRARQFVKRVKGDRQPAKAFSCGRWISTLRG
jgi:hypothetical protein